MAKPPLLPSSQPLFSQIKEMIIYRIKAGEFNTAEPLPSETEFARYYNVSQGTVRKAITEIAAENLVVRYRGKGTFVASHTKQRENSHFFHIVDNNCVKRSPGTRILSCRLATPAAEMRDQLNCKKGEEVTVIERLRLFDDRPVIFETIVVSRLLFPDLCSVLKKTAPNELYPLYEAEYQTRIIRAEECISAVAADAREAMHLNIEIGKPLLQIDRVAFSIEDNPVELRRSQCNTENNHYQNVLR